MTPKQKQTTQPCCDDNCDSVPDEVIEAVLDSLERIPGGGDPSSGRDARAIDLAPRMAAEGWRFCPCFPLKRTREHERVFQLVHTNLANRLAHKEELLLARAS